MDQAIFGHDNNRWTIAMSQGRRLGYRLRSRAARSRFCDLANGERTFQACSEDTIFIWGDRFRYEAAFCIWIHGNPWFFHIRNTVSTSWRTPTNTMLVYTAGYRDSKKRYPVSWYVDYTTTSGMYLSRTDSSQPKGTDNLAGPLIVEALADGVPCSGLTKSALYDDEMSQSDRRASLHAFIHWLYDTCQRRANSISCFLQLETDAQTVAGYPVDNRAAATCTACVAPDRLTLSRINEKVAAVMSSRRRDLGDMRPLGNECIDQLGVIDANLYGFFRDLSSAGDTVKSIWSFIKDPDIAHGANAWLSNRYGDRLTVADVQEIIGSFSLDGYRSAASLPTSTRTRMTDRLTDESFSYDLTLTMTLRCHPKDGIADVLRKMSDFGIGLELSNVWDLVPYSFVVDWFVNVGDLFEAIDRRLYQSYWTIDTVVSARRIVSRPLHQSALTFSGQEVADLRSVDYDRMVEKSIPTMPFSLEFGCPDLVHVIDGTALLIQR